MTIALARLASSLRIQVGTAPARASFAAARRASVGRRAASDDNAAASTVDESTLTPRSRLAPMVLNGGTEPAFTSDLNDIKDPGTYYCARCLTPLFASTAKFDSGTGWPSFWEGAAPGAVDIAKGGFLTGFLGRECKCAECGGHLGHRFDDGPVQTTGKRFCINGAALRFGDAPSPVNGAVGRWPE